MAGLRERKRRKTRERIVDVAMQLFVADGFDAVSVSEIAEAAEVGRMTFFRYFGDKHEVVFAANASVFDEIESFVLQDRIDPSTGLSGCLQPTRHLVLRVIELLALDTDQFRRYYQVVDSSPELQSRAASKLRALSAAIASRLEGAGSEHGVAILAGHIGVACYETALASAERDPGRVYRNAVSAFEQLDTLRT